MSKKEPVYIHIESELGKKLKNIKLDYFSMVAILAMSKMSDNEQDVVNASAQRVVEETIDRLNEIKDARTRLALGAITAFNLATCIYLTIDEAMTAIEIDETFGGDGDE